MYNSKIIGVGKYVPDNVVTNEDLSKLMDTNDEWITERTGIKERRWVKEGSGDTTATMGVKAAKQAIERSGLDKDDIDFIIFAIVVFSNVGKRGQSCEKKFQLQTFCIGERNGPKNAAIRQFAGRVEREE